MINDIKKISVSEQDISEIVKRLGEQISKDYQDKEPIFIGLLKGCNPFMGDLLKHVNIYCTVDYMNVSSYSGTSSTGSIEIVQDITEDITNRNVILVDDICDTGRTLLSIKELLLRKGAKTVTICVLLDKPEGRVVDIEPVYTGGLVPNEFVVGYGLDYNERYRNLPFVGVLKEEIYSK